MLPSGGWEGAIAQRRQQHAQGLGEAAVRFRELIGHLGGGPRTSTSLSRTEAQEALALMLEGAVSPEQLGAFLIAHRLRRPTAEELAGFIDAYRHWGPQLPPSKRPVISFGIPFDGRSRDAPIYPLTALLLASAGAAVVLQGGDPMPVKYGATAAELLQALGLPLAELPWQTMGERFQRQGLALLHQPHHFPAAERLVPIRAQIGKRPPIATLELLWSCYPGPQLQVSGFVHAPTEALAWGTWALVGQGSGLTVKGLEGGIDLPTSRVSIAARWQPDTCERLVLHAREHGLQAAEAPLTTLAAWQTEALAALQGKGPLVAALIWNGGFYLWQLGLSDSLKAGLARAEVLIQEGGPEQVRQELAAALHH
jgi:anthranilate phosphoribosyltransferase